MTAGMHTLRKKLVPVLITTMCTILLPLSGCKIVPNDQRTAADGSSANRTVAEFDGAGYVESVWDSKLVPHFDKNANELSVVIDAVHKELDEAGKMYGHRADVEGSPWSFAVKSSAKVISLNTESRAGTLVVEIETSGGSKEVVLQIGPVFRGTAIRDSLPFFSFGKVTNQIEFAQVGRALNDRALKQIETVLPALKNAGTSIEFKGAISMTQVPEKFVITPVWIKPSAGSKQ